MMTLQKKENTTLQWFLSHCKIHKYPPKSTIIHQGEKVGNLYYIVQGFVSISVKDEEGKELVLYNLKKGNFLGEFGLFDHTQKHEFWTRAKFACEIAKISYKKFQKLIWINPDILMKLTIQLSRRLHVFTKRINTLELFYFIGIVTKFLLNLIKEAKYKNKIKILEISKITIKKETELSEKIISQVLKILEEQNFIIINKKTILIHIY